MQLYIITLHHNTINVYMYVFILGVSYFPSNVHVIVHILIQILVA